MSDSLRRVLEALTANAARASKAYRLDATCGRRAQLAGTAAEKHVGRYDLDDVEPVTRFHSVATPATSLAVMYGHLTARSAAFDDDTGLIAVTLMLRYQRTAGLPITMAMLHRVFLTAALVASKTHHDCRAIDNGTLARLFSVQLIDLNLMERRFLAGVDFRVAVFASDLEATLAELVRAPEVAADGESDSDDASHGPPLAGNQRLSRHGAAAAVDVGLPDDELPSSDTID